MSRTKRNIPVWAESVDWMCGMHKVRYMGWSGVCTLKGGRAGGSNSKESTRPNQKRLGKRIARKVARAVSHKEEKEGLGL
jgi:hypothetical protein